MLGLYFLGRFVESAIGFVRYLIAYLMTGVLSMLAFSAIAIQFSHITFTIGNTDIPLGDPEQLLVGASAAIMGSIGVIVALFLRDWRKEKSRIAAKRLGFTCFAIAIQFLFDFTTPQVSFLSHFLGLIIGFAIGLIL
jgi:rhomboid protease GluP